MNEYIEELDRLFVRRSSGNWSATSSRRVPERRHGFRLDHRRRVRASLPDLRLHVRLRSAARPPASSWRFDERAAAETCRICSRPSTTRWCSRPATWNACMPRLTWHLEEPRVGQSYPNFYVAQLASKFVKVVLSRRGRRRALWRLSVALLPRRRQRRASSTTSTSTTRSGSG